MSSYTLLVRDGILSRVKKLPFFSTFNFSSNRALRIRPESLPFCGVYFLQETSFPEGDANAAEVRFRTSARYGFSVIVLNNDADAAEITIDNAYQVLVGGLFPDFTLYNNPAFQIQAYTASSRTHVFGNMAQDNETPIAELRFELTCDLGTITYPPVIVDDLKTVHIKTQYPLGDTQDDIDKRQQVEAEITLESSKEEEPS